MKVLAYKVGEEPNMVEIDNELSDLQDFVSGYIECIRLSVGPYVLICNEEGKLHNFKPNRMISEIKDVIYGDFIVCGEDGEKFIGITNDDFETINNSGVIGGAVND